MIDHDRLFKELLGSFFPEFIELFFPQISADWQPDSIRFLPQEVFTDVTEGEKKIIDLIVQASFKNQDTLFIIHTEHQSYSQTDFNKRMFTYFARLHEKYALPIYPIVIYSYDTPTKPEPNSYCLELFGKTVLEFNYEVIQLNQLHWQEFINKRNPVASALMAKMRMDKVERHRVKLLSLQLPKKGRGQRAEGRRKEILGCPLPQGLKPLNLFMKKEENMYFEMRSTRNTTSLLNPLNLFMGITFCLLPSAFCLLNC